MKYENLYLDHDEYNQQGGKQKYKNLYPDYGDDDFQNQIYEKREFQYHRVPERDLLTDYDDIQDYRAKNCPEGDFKAKEHQIILKNFLNPETPYNGLIIMHGTGVGKTCSAIGIAEEFVEQAKQYDTKIFVVVPGTAVRENFKGELLFCTGSRYLKNKEILDQLDPYEQNREKKIATNNALHNYTIVSQKTFYNKVLGQKLKNTKDEEGNVVREEVINKITNINNSLLIIDEAHNLIDNEYGNALMKIIQVSKNLKVLLLTATPMTNTADQIVDLLNFLRPKNDKIKKNKVFKIDESHVENLEFKEGGMEYLKKKTIGYISYFRGAMPLTFAERIDEGKISDGLLFTKVTKCMMDDFQLKKYNETLQKFKDDKLSKKSSSVANFVFPGLSDDKKSIRGYSSTNEYQLIYNQVVNQKNKLLDVINKQLFRNKLSRDVLKNFITDIGDHKLSGNFLKLEYLNMFSSKYYQAIKNINELVENKKGSGTVFIYSNYVSYNSGGIELFAEALKVNGYHEFNEEQDYNIQDNSIDYKTGLTFKDYKKKYDANLFKPATYLLITGNVENDEEAEIKQKYIKTHFNQISNIDGKHIKIVLGSSVMNEGVSLKNVKEVHILDVYYNLGKLVQAIGRGIRMCKHIDVINDNNKYPQVSVFKYVIGLKGKLSTDEELYQKAEKKFKKVKDVEYILKRNAIDCPLLLHNNKFPEEIKKYKDCVPPTLENVKKGKKICPELCDFKPCDWKCEDKTLNKKHGNKTGYKPLNKDQVDYSTFTKNMETDEIKTIKEKIKDLFGFKYYYKFKDIKDKITKSLTPEQKELFEERLIKKALKQLSPKTDDDINNFTDNVYDENKNKGYLIKVNEYFVFQPYDMDKKTQIEYRKLFTIDYINQINVENYVKNNHHYIENSDKDIIEIEKNKKNKGYNFDNVMNYYDKREENKFVGIIDKKENKLTQDEDIFKLRPKLNKNKLKRGEGIHTITGTVCTSYQKNELNNIFKEINNLDIKIDKKEKSSLCSAIQDILLYNEKYSTSEKNNKKTYIMIPDNHPVYEFPYNLQDRIKYSIKQIIKITNEKLDYETLQENNGSFNSNNYKQKNLPNYIIKIKHSKKLEKYNQDIINIGFELIDNHWIKEIN